MYFSKIERYGVAALAVICAVVFLIPEFIFTGNKLPQPAPPDFHRDTSVVRAYSRASKRVEKKLFLFNPNTASVEDFKALGLPAFLAERIEKYRKKGGKFRKPEDFKKIYGMREEQYLQLAPYIKMEATALSQFVQPPENQEKFPETASNEPPLEERIAWSKPAGSKYEPRSIDVNGGDMEAWVQLPGIGEKRAAQIIRFREKLGGFTCVEQVGETYYLPDSVFQAIKPYLRVENVRLNQLNINSASAAEIEAHPYISKKQAGLIVNYREQHGDYKKVEDLFQIAAFQGEGAWLQKVLPYLKAE